MHKTPENIRLMLVPFQQLSTAQLYALLKLRCEVFVVEQECIYQDIDGLDEVAMHLLVADVSAQLLAYARILPPSTAFQEAAIGRIVTHRSWRGKGYGRWLISQSVESARQLYPEKGIRIGAQAHLQDFYQDCGFETVGEPYDEDGILHVEMLWSGTPQTEQ